MRAPLHPHEPERLSALRRYEILDSNAETAYQGIVELAASICDTPMALISFVDEDRQWFKAKVGLGARETPRDISFCAHCILMSEPLVVPDARLDKRFADNSLVTGDLGIRSYAGVQLKGTDGLELGTLCAIDVRPGGIAPDQLRKLELLAEQVVFLLESRHTAKLLFETMVEKDRVEQEAQVVRQRFDYFMARAPIGCSIKDSEGRFCYVNQFAADAIGVPAEKVLGSKFSDWFPEEVSARNRKPELEALASGVAYELVTINDHQGGEPRTFSAQKFSFKDSLGKVYVGSVSLDITDQQAAKKQLENMLFEQTKLQVELESRQKDLQIANLQLKQLSVTDGLTKLFNRYHFEERLAAECSLYKRYSDVFSVVMIDVDNFKKYNDSFGHPAGDEVLIKIAEILQSEGRGSDFVARYGGEEFVMVLPRTTTDQALLFTERVRAKIAEFQGFKRTVTASFGVAASTRFLCDEKSILEAADQALYASKIAGRNRVTDYSEIDLTIRVAPVAH